MVADSKDRLRGGVQAKPAGAGGIDVDLEGSAEPQDPIPCDDLIAAQRVFQPFRVMDRGIYDWVEYFAVPFADLSRSHCS